MKTLGVSVPFQDTSGTCSVSEDKSKWIFLLSKETHLFQESAAAIFKKVFILKKVFIPLVFLKSTK